MSDHVPAVTEPGLPLEEDSFWILFTRWILALVWIIIMVSAGAITIFLGAVLLPIWGPAILIYNLTYKE